VAAPIISGPHRDAKSADCRSPVCLVTAFQEAQGLLSRFDFVYLGYIAQGVSAGALVGCYEPTAQVLLHSYTHALSFSRTLTAAHLLLCVMRDFEMKGENSVLKMQKKTPTRAIHRNP
jgi:hypothetical protein